MVRTKPIYNEAVAAAVATGLGASPKTLPSWLFYDEKGDQIFQQIMRMPEYYPTRCEYDILKKYKDELMRHFAGNGEPFSLIELGSGDALKTEILISHFLRNKTAFSYIPIDISANALEMVSRRLLSSYPDLQLQPINKTYDEALSDLDSGETRKIVLFMGANIGNFAFPEASQFLNKLARHLAGQDRLLVGFDLKKDPRVILEAYDDPRGLTRQFNLNLLTRLNRELGARFVTSRFSHYPFYDPENGTTKSFLISMSDQSVAIDALGQSFRFRLWETIQTEVSQKYDIGMIERILALSGLAPVAFFFDNDQYFCDVLVRPE